MKTLGFYYLVGYFVYNIFATLWVSRNAGKPYRTDECRASAPYYVFFMVLLVLALLAVLEVF